MDRSDEKADAAGMVESIASSQDAIKGTTFNSMRELKESGKGMEGDSEGPVVEMKK